MNNKTGAIGEKFAENFLKKQDYTTICCNFHSRFGEIDIIAKNDQYIVFVEVKTRNKTHLVSPLESVTLSKQRKIVKTAMVFLQQHPQNLQPRFDVAAILTEKGNITDIQYIENAFGGNVLL